MHVLILLYVYAQVKHYGRINRPPNLLTLKTKTTTTTAENLWYIRGGLLALVSHARYYTCGIYTRARAWGETRARTHTSELKSLLNTITVGTKRVPLIL